MKKIILILVALSLESCATMSEDQKMFLAAMVLIASSGHSHQQDAFIQQQQLLNIQNSQQALMSSMQRR